MSYEKKLKLRTLLQAIWALTGIAMIALCVTGSCNGRTGGIFRRCFMCGEPYRSNQEDTHFKKSRLTQAKRHRGKRRAQHLINAESKKFCGKSFGKRSVFSNHLFYDLRKLTDCGNYCDVCLRICGFLRYFVLLFCEKVLNVLGGLGLSGNGKFSSKRNFILTLFYGEKLKDVLRLADFRLF